MVLKLTKPAPKAEVSKEVKNNSTGQVMSEDKHEEQVEVPGDKPVAQTAVPWCMVGVDMSYTHNLGNFTSVRMGVRVDLPCLHEEINDTYDFAKGWAEERMNAMIAEVAAE